MNTVALLSENEIIIRQRKLPSKALYRWKSPVLIIPLDCTLADLKQIISDFEQIKSPPRATNTK